MRKFLKLRSVPGGLTLARGWVALFLSTLPPPLRAAQPIRIDNIANDGGAVRLQFTDQRLATNSLLNYAVEFSPTLGEATAWTKVNGLSFSPLPLNNLGRSVTVPTSMPTGFYRIIGTDSGVVTTPDDTDGDGLPNATELLIGSNPNLFDSDGDSFSDSVEYQYGTNPKDASSFPVLTNLPRAEFAEAISYGTEGSPHQVKVQFDKPYFGVLNFAVLPQSTAKEGIDFAPLTLSVTVAGTSALIPLLWRDDGVISPDRVLFLELKTDAALPYARGGRTRHTVLLSENDAWWMGVLVDKYAQRNFQLKILHIGGVITQITFAAGAGNDGLPLLAGDNGAAPSSQSEGVVPVGSFPATVESATLNHFKITSPAMPAPTGGLFGAGTGLTRTLVLESLPATSGPPNGQSIEPGRIVGTYTERLAFPGQAPCAVKSGTVILVRQLPARPNVIQ